MIKVSRTCQNSTDIDAGPGLGPASPVFVTSLPTSVASSFPCGCGPPALSVRVHEPLLPYKPAAAWKVTIGLMGVHGSHPPIMLSVVDDMPVLLAGLELPFPLPPLAPDTVDDVSPPGPPPAQMVPQPGGQAGGPEVEQSTPGGIGSS